MNWYQKREPILDAGARAEIEELYDGSPGVVTHLARIYKVSRGYMMYVCNHNDKRKKASLATIEWIRKNRHRPSMKKAGAEASRRYYHRKKEKILQQQRAYRKRKQKKLYS